MAFALKKTSNDAASDNVANRKKRSPLAGWLGKKAIDDADDGIPQMDVAAGLDRALRNRKAVMSEPDNDHQENPVRETLSAIEAALYAVDRIRDILEQACEVVISAKDVDDIGGRALLAESYDELRLSINEALEKSDPRAAALIGKNQHHLDVTLGGRTKYSVSPVRLDIGEKGLNLAPPVNAFANFDEIDATLSQLDYALGRADNAAASYCRDAQYLIARMKVEIANI
ncbi:hypothetical protein [Hyphococcus sp. DH-69]|uniref:hypothetical protein n=1 Tax=Hyphococcus formosus TaxID=3143534 RepID=UPI00398AAE62